MDRLFWGMGIGAGLMFFLDRDQGKRRRARVRDKVIHITRDLADHTDTTVRDARNRAQGLWWGAKRVLARDEATDEVLVERVRARLGRAVSHPHAIEVESREGRVLLRGPILASEVKKLLAAVRSVKGVKKVEDQLEPHKHPDTPSLQGGSGRPRSRPEVLQESWSPAIRLAIGAGGLSLLGYGRSRGGLIGGATRLLGLGVLLRSAANRPLRRLLGLGRGPRAFQVQKTFHVQAPLDRVWQLWAGFESFPLFMAHVKEVRDLGGRRSHWVVSGPGGIPLEWDASITSLIPGEMIGWRTDPGAVVQHAGTVRFEEEGEGRTRVDIRMCYNPPGGVIGETVAGFLGADPKSRMDEDLVRLKTLLEKGKIPHDAAQPLPRVETLAGEGIAEKEEFGGL